MKKFIVTFGSDQLEGFNVRPMQVMLVLEGETEQDARVPVFKSPFNGKFCTSYKYEDRAEEFKSKYGMIEYEMHELMSKYTKDDKLIVILNKTHKSLEAARTIYHFDALSYKAGKAIEEELTDEGAVSVEDDGCELSIFKATKEEIFEHMSEFLKVNRICIEGDIDDSSR